MDAPQGGGRLPRGLGGGSRNLGNEAGAVDLRDERADRGAAAAVLALPPQAAGVLGRRVDRKETGAESHFHYINFLMAVCFWSESIN